jgi:hypothetical protein
VDEEVSLQGRDTQGVHLKRLEEDDSIVSFACFQEGNNKVGGDNKVGGKAKAK